MKNVPSRAAQWTPGSVTARRSRTILVTFAVAALLSTAVFSGLNGIAAKVLYRDAHFDAFGLLAARGAWTLPLAAALAWIARPERMPSAADWWRLSLLAFCYGPMACGFIALGAQYTSGAHLSILLSLAPPLTAVAGAALLGERVDRLRVLALAIGVGGAVLLASTRSSTGSSLTGDLLLIVTLAGVAMMFVLIRRLAPHYNVIFLTGIYGVMAMTEILFMGILGGGASSMVRVWQSSPTALWFFGVLVLGMSTCVPIAQTYAMRTIGAGTASMLSSYGALIVGLVASVVILHERIEPAGMLAATLIALSIGLALVPTREPKSSEAAIPAEATP
jgi:drug/metabolite transporter (DMT)-like permease